MEERPQSLKFYSIPFSPPVLDFDWLSKEIQNLCKLVGAA